MFIDKESGNINDRYNRSAGIDANFIIHKKLALSGFLAKTFSADPLLRGKSWASVIDANYTSNLAQAEVFRSTVQPNFNPEVGFVDRTDIITNSVDLQFSPRPKHGAVREYNFEAFYRRAPDTHGVLQTQEWQTTFRANFHNGAYTDDDLFDNFIQRLNEPFNIFRNVIIPAGIYHFDRHQFTYGTDASKRLVARFFERFGTYYNGKLNEFRTRINYRPTTKISIAGVHEWDRFRFPHCIFNVQIGSLNTGYSFNRLDPQKSATQTKRKERKKVPLFSSLKATVDVGGRFRSVKGDKPGKFAENSDTPKVFSVRNFSLNFSTVDSPYWLDFRANEIGERGQRFKAEANRVGVFHSTVLWDQLPKYYSTDNTFHLEAAPGVLVVNPALRASLQAVPDAGVGASVLGPTLPAFVRQATKTF